MLLSGKLKSFYTLALPILACMSLFSTFSYLKNACKVVRKGLEVGNGPKGSKTQPNLTIFQREIGKKV